MKQARTGNLLPIVLMVVALGILHTMQKAGAPLPSPAKDVVVVLGLLMFGAAIVYMRSARHEGYADELAAASDRAPEPPRNEDAEKTQPPVSLNEYDLSA